MCVLLKAKTKNEKFSPNASKLKTKAKINLKVKIQICTPTLKSCIVLNVKEERRREEKKREENKRN